MLIGVGKKERQLLDWLKTHSPLALVLYAFIRYSVDLLLNWLFLAVAVVPVGLWEFGKVVVDFVGDGGVQTWAAVRGMGRIIRWWWTLPKEEKWNLFLKNPQSKKS